MTTTSRSVGLVSELNDLLQLDYDAVAGYTIALNALDDLGYQDAVRTFKADHERHIDELIALIKSHGGVPVPIPHVTGEFKRAAQEVGPAGSDAEIIEAIKANEVQSRDVYRRAASKQHPTDVQGVLIRCARDEQRHFDWTMRTLSELGVNTGSVAEALEEMRPRAVVGVERMKRVRPPVKMIGLGLMLVGTALAVRALTRD